MQMSLTENESIVEHIYIQQDTLINIVVRRKKKKMHLNQIRGAGVIVKQLAFAKSILYFII